MKPPVLLIHGVSCGGDVWGRFAAGLAARGYETAAPTIFPDRRPIDVAPSGPADLTLKDYLDAAEAEANRLASFGRGKPAVIGHSMGGLLAQALAARQAVAAAVFLTPAAPADCLGLAFSPFYTFWNIIRANDTTRWYKVWRKGFDWGVMNGVAPERRDSIYAGTRFDPGLVYRDLGRPAEDPNRIAFIDEKDIHVPTLTIAAGRDRATPASSVRRVARKYAKVGGTFREYAHHAHWIVDEPGTDTVIADIADWFDAAFEGTTTL
jgi:pimeloyl-ACP methyl ester carboxylesterase